MRRPFWQRFLRKLVVLCILIAIVLGMMPTDLGVTPQYQMPSLPNGCEVVSLSMVMRYHGISADPGLLADRYLTKSAIGVGDPKSSYIGEPRGDGYYSFEKPLVQAANVFFKENGYALTAGYHPFTPFGEITWRLHNDQPVIVWYTLDEKWPKKFENMEWTLPSGKTHIPYENLHVVVVDGISGPFVHIVDPMQGERWVGLWRFLPIYYAMGARAISIGPMD